MRRWALSKHERLAPVFTQESKHQGIIAPARILGQRERADGYRPLRGRSDLHLLDDEIAVLQHGTMALFQILILNVAKNREIAYNPKKD